MHLYILNIHQYLSISMKQIYILLDYSLYFILLCIFIETYYYPSNALLLIFQSGIFNHAYQFINTAVKIEKLTFSLLIVLLGSSRSCKNIIASYANHFDW